MIMPYINFSGNCEAAFKWYEEIFDGKIMHLVKYGDMPDNPEMPMTREQKDQVMHAQLMLTESGGISGADAMWLVEKGSMVNIQAHCSTAALAERIFAALAEDGAVLSALISNPPPDDDGISGMVKDKFDITWIISALKDKTVQ